MPTDSQKISNKKFRLIFMGTPDFAKPGLTALIADSNFEIVSVFTQADKAVGRHQDIISPPVKNLATYHDLPVLQPVKLKTETATIKNLKPDLIVVIAYGQIIPPEILAIPRFGCINVHASLLPKYRGAACLNAPILNGDKETGLTIMGMESGLDTGPILRQAKIKLNGQENLKEVHDKLAKLSAKLLIPTLQDFIAGKIKATAQNKDNASYVKAIKKEDGRIDWTKSALVIERMVRAYHPWPGTYTYLDGEVLKVAATAVAGDIFGEPGTILSADKTGVCIACGEGALVVGKLQLPGKKRLSAMNFLSGRPLFPGTILGA